MKSAIKRLDWGLLAVLAVAVALRVHNLTERSLWYDEASSWQTARFAPADLMRSVRLNVHMPLYYLLLKLWMGVWGESVPSLRGFSITFGALTVVGMYLFADALYRETVLGEESADRRDRRGFALAVAGLVAVSPYQVFASIEARMYSLGTALAAFGSWLLLRALRDPRRARPWVAYGAIVTALLYTHHYALFTVAAQFAFVGFTLVWLAGIGSVAEARAVSRAMVAVGVAVTVAYLPGILILQTQTRRVQEDYWISGLTWERVVGTFLEFLVPLYDQRSLASGWLILAMLVLAGVIVAAGGRRGDGFLLASAVLPLLASAAVSMVQPVWVGRYFRFTHLFLLTVLVLALWKVTRHLRALRVAGLVLLIATMLGGNVVFWDHIDVAHGPGIRKAVATILEGRKGDELIVALDLHQYFTAKYYVGARARIRLIEPPPDLFWGWHLIRPHDLITPRQLDEELHRGVWFLGTLPHPLVVPSLVGVEPLQTSSVTYYHSLHGRVFVHHFAIPSPSSRAEGSAP